MLIYLVFLKSTEFSCPVTVKFKIHVGVTSGFTDQSGIVGPSVREEDRKSG